MNGWQDLLKTAPLPSHRDTGTVWLLEPENPSVRYGTLTDLLNRPANDLEVRAARTAIPTYPPVTELLAAQ